MANLSDMLPTPNQTIVSTSEWANPYIEEAMGLIKVPLALIMVGGMILLLVKAFEWAFGAIEEAMFVRRQGHHSEKWYDEHPHR